jgi:hypothetical protein
MTCSSAWSGRAGTIVLEAGASAFDVVGRCFYRTANGHRYPHNDPGGGYGWEGRQTATEPGDRIGMLLDLDQGSMTVWKNNE